MASTPSSRRSGLRLPRRGRLFNVLAVFCFAGIFHYLVVPYQRLFYASSDSSVSFGNLFALSDFLQRYTATDDKQDFRLNVFLHIGGPSYESGVRSHRALSRADHGGDSVTVTVVADKPKSSSDKSSLEGFLKELSTVDWNQSVKNVMLLNRSVGDTLSNPRSIKAGKEYTLFLDTGVTLPSTYYSQIKQTILDAETRGQVKDVAALVIALDQSGPLRTQKCIKYPDKAVAVLFPTAWHDFNTRSGVDVSAARNLTAVQRDFFAYAIRKKLAVLLLHGFWSARGPVPVAAEHVRLCSAEELARSTVAVVRDFSLPVARKAGVSHAAPAEVGMPATAQTSLISRFLATNDIELQRLVRFVANKKDGTSLTIVTANSGMQDMLFNWICFMRRLKLSSYLVYSVDPELARQLAMKGIAAYTNHNTSLDANTQTRWRWFGTVQYQQLILERTRFVDHILDLGYNVLLADIDSVWLQDPFPYLNTSGNPAADDYYDIAGQMDQDSLCGGFMFLRNTPTTLQLWNALTKEHELMVADAVDRGKLKRDIDSEQLILEGFLKSNKFSKLRLRALDPLLFPHGRTYFEHQLPQMQGLEPVVIHNNYIKGMPKKILRFKAGYLWALHDAYCNLAVLEVRPWERFLASTANSHSLARLIPAVAVNKTVFVFSVGDAAERLLLLNLACYLRILKTTNYIVSVSSTDLGTDLARRHVPTYVDPSPHAAALLVQQVLSLGYHVVLSDIDAVWLHVPPVPDVAADGKGADPPDVATTSNGPVFLRASKHSAALWNVVLEQLRKGSGKEHMLTVLDKVLAADASRLKVRVAKLDSKSFAAPGSVPVLPSKDVAVVRPKSDLDLRGKVGMLTQHGLWAAADSGLCNRTQVLATLGMPLKD